MPDASSADVGRADAGLAASCRADDECDDRAYCNGDEHCMPADARADAFGCVAGTSPCLAGQACDEAHAECTTICGLTRDADGDGAIAIACDGDDCDDADARRRPGNLEVCDEDDVDEDCDASTFGTRDADGDGAVDALCCNGTGGERHCGTDCNDASRLERPEGSERCDGRDQDCDGMVDEGVLAMLPVDADRDLHGDETSTALACPGTVGASALSDDCRDDDPNVHAAQVEIRDLLDDDCDGHVDEDVHDVTFFRDLDGDGFGSAASGVVRSDAPVAGYVLLGTDCDDSDPTTSPIAVERCNGRDDDCNGLADFAIAPGDFEDDDHDGSLDADCVGGDDCVDVDATIHAGALELCDTRDNDCDTRTDEDVGDASWWLDRDGDGFGDTTSPPIVTCRLVSGRVLLPGDCDDDDDTVAPRRGDDCAHVGVDDDCDGTVDENGARLATYRDADGDGFGTGAPVLACAIGAGRTDTPGDCDDAAAGSSPAGVEVCASGADEDCDTLSDCADSACVSTTACITSFDLTLRSGAGQHARVDEALAMPLVVCVSAGGAPSSGRTIDAHPPAGVAVRPTRATSAADGCASFDVTLGRAAGLASITFASPLATMLVVTATADAAPPTSVHTVANLTRVLGAVAPGAAIGGTFGAVSDVVATPAGDLFVADAASHVVVRIDPSGALTILAGTGATTGALGDGGPATLARLVSPSALAVDGARLLVADAADHRVRVVDLASGRIDTLVGTGSAVGDQTTGIPGNAFALAHPRALAVATDHGVWIGDDTAAWPFAPDGTSLAGAIAGACARCPSGRTCAAPPSCALAIEAGALLYSQSAAPVGPCVSSDGLAYAIVSGPSARFVGGCRLDGTGLPMRVADLALDGAGNLLVADADGTLVRIDRSSAAATPIAGGTVGGEHGAATTAAIAPSALASTPSEIVFAEGVAVRVASGLDRAGHDHVVLTPTGSASLAGVVTLPIALAVDATDALDAPIVGLALDADLGVYGRLASAATTDASGHASIDVRSWIVPRTFDVLVSAQDIHGVPAASARFTLTTSAPASGTVLTLAGLGTETSLGRVATHAALPTLGDAVTALAGAASRHVFVHDDGTLWLPGIRIDATGVAHLGPTWIAAGPRPDVVAVDPAGGVFVRSYSADARPVDVLAHLPASGAPRTLLPQYVDVIDVPNAGGEETYYPLWVTTDGRLFEGPWELDPATGRSLAPRTGTTSSTPWPFYSYRFVDERSAVPFSIDGTSHVITGPSGGLLGPGTTFVPGQPPSDVAVRDMPSLVSAGTPGVLLLANVTAGVGCSGAILRLAFDDPAFGTATGTTSLVAGSTDGSTSDASDGIPATTACLSQPSLVGVDAARHVYFVDASPPRLRMIW